MKPSFSLSLQPWKSKYLHSCRPCVKFMVIYHGSSWGSSFFLSELDLGESQPLCKWPGHSPSLHLASRNNQTCSLVPLGLLEGLVASLGRSATVPLHLRFQLILIPESQNILTLLRRGFWGLGKQWRKLSWTTPLKYSFS